MHFPSTLPSTLPEHPKSFPALGPTSVVTLFCHCQEPVTKAGSYLIQGPLTLAIQSV